MVVLPLRSHASDVEAQRCLYRPKASRNVVGDVEGHEGTNSEAFFGGGELLGVHLLTERRVIEGKPTIRDFCSLRDVLRTFSSEINRNFRTQRMGHDLERFAKTSGTLAVIGHRVELAVVLKWPLAAQCPANDVDIFTGAGQWLI